MTPYTCWNGYKLHADVSDGGIPLSAILTSASLHDSQAAIPLAQKSAERITNLYDLMDAAYDAPQIRVYSIALRHIPIIDDGFGWAKALAAWDISCPLGCIFRFDKGRPKKAAAGTQSEKAACPLFNPILYSSPDGSRCYKSVS